MTFLLRFLSILICCIALPLRAEIIDLTEHSMLKGAYLVQQPHAEFVTIQLLMHVGEADNDGPEGLSHYLEHLVWTSADKAHEEGDKGRVANAWASNGFTNYWNDGPTAKLNDMLRFAARVFVPVDLAPEFARTERDVVEREFDLRMLDNPLWQLGDQMDRDLVPGHGVTRSVIGTRESIRALTPKMAYDFQNMWYVASNATLLVSGPVSERSVARLLALNFSDLPDADLPPRRWAEPITWDKREVQTRLTHPALTEPRFFIRMKAPPPPGMATDELAHAVRLLARYLDGSTVGSPRKALYYDDFVVNGISAGVWLDRAGMITLNLRGEPDPEVDLDTAIARTRAYFADLTGVSEVGFAQIKGAEEDRVAREINYASFERQIALDGILDRGVPYGADGYLEATRAVTPAQLDLLIEALQTNGITAIGTAFPEDDP